ncbi:MAG: glycosidase [Dehalococcoidia bacterium]|nr:MAG: glycosidase [Dehalococcoidia bacterium]
MELSLKLKRSEKNPILGPTESWWENKLVFNAGVLQLGNKIHLIYRAHGEDKIARLGYARLRNIDEVEERLPHPIFMREEWFEPDGVEDPRLVAIEDRIFMLYAGKDKDMARVCESHISVADFSAGKWTWSRHRLILPIMVGIHNRNATYFPRRFGQRLLLLHRPIAMAQNIWLSFSYDSIHWYEHKEILKARPGYWDEAKVGVAGPPIELEEGWLLIYHGVEAKTWTYRLGCALLDRDHPEVVLERCEGPILEPVEDYECSGSTPNTVFSCGAIISEGKLVLYYGAADKVIGVAIGDLPGKPI